MNIQADCTTGHHRNGGGNGPCRTGKQDDRTAGGAARHAKDQPENGNRAIFHAKDDIANGIGKGLANALQERVACRALFGWRAFVVRCALF